MMTRAIRIRLTDPADKRATTWYLLCASIALLIAAGPLARALPAGPATDWGLYNTGVDDDEIPLADNEVDPHYELIEPSLIVGETIVATSEGGFPIPPWVPDSPISAWITPSEDTAGPGDFDVTVPSYIYRTRFDLTGVALDDLSIEGRWSTDNLGLDIVLNDNSLGIGNPAQFGGYTQFVMDTGFVNGINTLDFLVNNGGNEDNPDGPTGLRVEFAGNGPPPPPPIPPHPDRIVGLFNTGVDDDNQVLVGGAIADPHYAIVEGPPDGEPLEALTVPEDGFPIGPWFANDSDSRWISPPDVNGATDANGPPGLYVYEVRFDMTGKDLDNFSISGSWGTDNSGEAIVVNGTVVPGINARQFGSRTWFGFNAAALAEAGAKLKPGENTLQFEVLNAGDDVNPTGLRIDDMVARAAPIGAAAIPGLFNTGVDDDGNLLPLGDEDPHYRLVEKPDDATEPSVALFMPPGAWVDNTATSQWIGTSDSDDGSSPPGEYAYELEFDLTNVDAANVTILGLWSADNVGTDILLNGQPTDNPALAGFGTLSEFEISTRQGNVFLPEKNTLTFLVSNAGDDFNPAGLRVEGLVAYALAGMAGDFNGNGELDAEDIDLLSRAVREMVFQSEFDLNADGAVTGLDRELWIEGLAETWIGDSNLDGVFDTADFISVFQAGEYEDAEPLNSGWATGDWNGDGDFNSTDFLVAFQAGGFEQGPRRPLAAAVPEPSAAFVTLIGLTAAAAWISRRRRLA